MSTNKQVANLHECIIVFQFTILPCICYRFLRIITCDLGLPLTNDKKLIILLLVDQQISYSALNDCIDISTNSTIMVINFGDHFLTNAPTRIHTCVVTDMRSAINVVWNYYK